MEKSIKNSYSREIYLDLLLSHLNDNTHGRPKHLILCGQKNIGKTYLLKKFIEANNKDLISLVDLSRIPLTPEHFAISIILQSSSSIKRKKISNLDDCKVGEMTSEIISKVKNELLKIKPSYKLLVELALTYPEAIAVDTKKKITICLDEFWKILDLNKFDQINNIISDFLKITKDCKSTLFILSSSAIHLIHEINSVLNFEIAEIRGLKLSDTNDETHYYSNGVPLYANCINSQNNTNNLKPKEAFLTESLWTSGIIYNSCKHILNESMARARGKGLLLAILNSVCNNNGLRLSEISRKIYRTAPVTKNLITRLIEVDILTKEGNLFMFSDPILKFWFRNYINSNEYDYPPDKNSMKKIEVNL